MVDLRGSVCGKGACVRWWFSLRHVLGGVGLPSLEFIPW